MKYLFLLISFMLASSLCIAQQSDKFVFQDHLEIYTGLGLDISNKLDFDKAKDLNSAGLINVGLRYKAFQEIICVQFDYSFGLPFTDYDTKYIGGITLDFSVIKFSKSYIALGARFQTMYMSFEGKENELLDKYSIKNACSVGPMIRFKNRAFNVETGYLFGVNSSQWKNVGNTVTLPEEKISSFILKLSVNIPLLK